MTATDKYRIPEIPDAEYGKLTDAEQKAYNRKIEAKSEYNRARVAYNDSMSVTGPGLLVVAGLFFGLAFPPLFLLALAGLVWLVIRVMSRSHAYQRFRDAEEALKKELAQ